jgi:hypothetical protein
MSFIRISAPSSSRQATNLLKPKIAYFKANYKRDVAFVIILAEEVNKEGFLYLV